MTGPRVILMGGTSHTGKSTLARRLAQRPGWTHISTDSLARHPGRPWGEVGARPHVAKYYLELTDQERLRSVLAHYRNMLPLIERLAQNRANDQSMERLVLEGSGLLPENVAQLRVPGVAAIWLTATEPLLRSRIYKESGYERLGDRGRKMIEAFVFRAVSFDHAIVESLRKFDLPFLEVRDGVSIDDLARVCLETMRSLT